MAVLAVAGHALAVSGGAASGWTEYPFVGRLRNADGLSSCSAVLVTPAFVLTANHCVTGETGPESCYGFAEGADDFDWSTGDFRVHFWPVNQGTYPRRLKTWVRPTLLIIDDVGLGQVRKRADEPTAAHTLYNILDRRHGESSTAITSNIDLSDWGRYLGDATLTAAILDRLAMHAICVDIDGPSYRQHVAQQRAVERRSKRAGAKSTAPRPSP